MFVEKEIEDKICALVREALGGVDGVKVEGAWSQYAAGEVKGEVATADHAVVAVATGSPQFESFTMTNADIPVALAVAVRREIAPDGAALCNICAPLSALLLRWQGGDVQELSTDNFRVDGVRLDSGDAPVFSPDNDVWTMERAFTVRGAPTKK